MGNITTEAWVLYGGGPSALPGKLVKEPFAFPEITEHEVLVEPLYGSWEGNMTHAIDRDPVDICRLRKEDKVVVGDSGVVRILRVGSAVRSVKAGDTGIVFAGPAWAVFSLRYLTAYNNWNLAYRGLRGRPHCRLLPCLPGELIARRVRPWSMTLRCSSRPSVWLVMVTSGVRILDPLSGCCSLPSHRSSAPTTGGSGVSGRAGSVAGEPGLGNPNHLFALDALTAVMPDALVVHLHRDMREVVPSLCSLMQALHKLTRPAPDDQSVSAYATNLMHRMVNRMLDFRRGPHALEILDVPYRTLVQDPLAVVRQIYERLGRTVDDRGTRAMQGWLADNPQHKGGTHRYSLEQFHLDPEAISRLFQPYTDRFIEPHPGPR